ncbi:unnamed protein product [Notodromas monacha]|uniref:Uncharacterized protein n=1 Tax=Notodromas monacha TaxID=399045 RepID=A0A7R9BZ69_9CRUS|nr:unnamed protein product [Notodromas monacha]CAG0923533.1 unnamed protein product [Notodromas monacha]
MIASRQWTVLAVAGIVFLAANCFASLTYEDLASLEAANSKRHMLIPFPRMGKSVAGLPIARLHYPIYQTHSFFVDPATIGAALDDAAYEDLELTDLAFDATAAAGKRALWLGPRLGRKKRHSASSIITAGFLKPKKPFGAGHVLKRSPFAPRLGKKRASPIAPRLGRPDPIVRSLYSPRIGKDLEISEKQQMDQQQNSEVPANLNNNNNDMEPRDLFIPRLG